jgi:hypothetical protein
MNHIHALKLPLVLVLVGKNGLKAPAGHIRWEGRWALTSIFALAREHLRANAR